MAGSANVTSLDAVCNFTAALIAFHDEANLCLTAMDAQLRQIQLWLERDRPVFWKREVEDCTRNVSEARIRLHQCRMRRVGDFRPTCFEEQKDLEQAKRNLDFAQHQVPTVKHWLIATGHEANEFHGRASQLVQFLHRDIPHLMSILKTTIERISSYAAIESPAGHVDLSAIRQLATSMEKTLAGLADASPSAESVTGDDAASGLSGPESIDPASDSSEGAGSESGKEL